MHAFANAVAYLVVAVASLRVAANEIQRRNNLLVAVFAGDEVSRDNFKCVLAAVIAALWLIFGRI